MRIVRGPWHRRLLRSDMNQNPALNKPEAQLSKCAKKVEICYALKPVGENSGKCWQYFFNNDKPAAFSKAFGVQTTNNRRRFDNGFYALTRPPGVCPQIASPPC